MAKVYFIDTSVFCNILPVPGMDQARDQMLEELKTRKREATLILPVTTIIETGNHIATKVSAGGERRAAAARFVGVLQLVSEGKAPWTLHQFTWNREVLLDLINGVGSGKPLHVHAEEKVGAGDLAILAEMRAYKARVQTADVAVWSLDAALSAYGHEI